eukprot:scaffold48128_cov281-Isochrysis_galbana.AAC.1
MGSATVHGGSLSAGGGHTAADAGRQRQGTVRRNRFTESLAVRLEVVCLGRLRACFKAVLKAHPTVYGWLIGSRVRA